MLSHYKSWEELLKNSDYSGLLHNFSMKNAHYSSRAWKVYSSLVDVLPIVFQQATFTWFWAERNITSRNLRLMFQEGWRVNTIEASSFELSITENKPPAWLASITYVGQIMVEEYMNDHTHSMLGYDADMPVLIVGGSLVGLSTSLFLSWHGIPSLLVERHAGISPHPRAFNFTCTL